jgi:hypothetical protein
MIDSTFCGGARSPRTELNSCSIEMQPIVRPL